MHTHVETKVLSFGVGFFRFVFTQWNTTVSHISVAAIGVG